MSQFYKLTVNSIKKLTEQSVVISFHVPEDLKQKFVFKAGQYITLKMIIKNEEVRRNYSICNSVNSGDLKIGVKAIDDGKFSVFANTQLKVGDIIEVAKPSGRFVFEANNAKTRTIAAFAAGSGITPILSIAKTVLEDEPFSNFILVYGNKSPEDVMFAKTIMQLKSTYENRFHTHYVYSQVREDYALFGHIDKNIVDLILKNKYKDVAIEIFYLCGPEEMINLVKDALVENNIKPNQILFELFTNSSVTKKTSAQDLDSNQTAIKVLVDDEEFEFLMSKQDTILDSTLKQDIDAPYSCQGGICGSCIARITKGEAIMQQNHILTDSEVYEGLVLTCQATPTSSSIIVNYDDV